MKPRSLKRINVVLAVYSLLMTVSSLFLAVQNYLRYGWSYTSITVIQGHEFNRTISLPSNLFATMLISLWLVGFVLNLRYDQERKSGDD